MKIQHHVSRRQAIANLGVAATGLLSFRSGAAQDHHSLALFAIVEVAPGQSLRDAVDNALQTSNNLLLLPGTYDIDRSLRLPSGVRFTGAGTETVIRPTNNFQGESVFLIANERQVTIRDLVIDGQFLGLDCNGVNVSGAQSFTLKDLHISQMSRRGINVWNSQRGFINGCLVTKSGDRGIVLGASKRCRIERCSVTDSTVHGIWVINGSRDIIVRGNTLLNNNRSGIELFEDNLRCAVIQNQCFNNGKLGVHLKRSSNSLVFENDTRSNVSNGVDLSDSSKIRSISNFSKLNGGFRDSTNRVEGHGILLWGTGQSIVLYNTAINNSQGNDQGNTIRAGIRINNRNGSLIPSKNNVVVSNICLDDQAVATQNGLVSSIANNLLLSNHLTSNRVDISGGRGQQALRSQSVAHNVLDQGSNFHIPAPPVITSVGELPTPTEALCGHMVLLQDAQADVLYICRKQDGELNWFEIITDPS